jgi:hypothetical protein
VFHLRGVSTNKTIICFIAMQTYKELIEELLVITRKGMDKVKISEEDVVYLASKQQI